MLKFNAAARRHVNRLTHEVTSGAMKLALEKHESGPLLEPAAQSALMQVVLSRGYRLRRATSTCKQPQQMLALHGDAPCRR